ncbi:unnamed protein product, partial [marine sediment metagenome]
VKFSTTEEKCFTIPIDNLINKKLELGPNSTTAYFYSNASGVVDGYAKHDVSQTSWSAVRDGAGTGATYDYISYGDINVIESGSSDGYWVRMTRGFFLFNTAAIPDDDVIESATLSLHGYQKVDNLGITPDVNIYSSFPASNTKLVAADFSKVGNTSFSTTISYVAWDTSDYNDFVLNAAGKAAIDKTGVSKFSARSANYDAADTPPSWSSADESYINVLFEYGGSVGSPMLTVTYAPADQPPFFVDYDLIPDPAYSNSTLNASAACWDAENNS